MSKVARTVAAAIESLALPALPGLTGPGCRVLTPVEGASALVFGLLAARWLHDNNQVLPLDSVTWSQPYLPGWAALVAAAPAGLHTRLADVPLVGDDPLSALYTAWLSRHARHQRQSTGTWFTPPQLATAVLGLVDTRLPLDQPRVLDPAVGTGAFLLAAAARWPGAHLRGADVDATALVLAAARLRRAGLVAELTLQDSLAAPDFGPVDLVCGNPPWWREPAGGAGGGWITAGDPRVDGGRPPFDDLRQGVPGGHLKNLFNAYVYFVRMAHWQVFQQQQRGRAAVAFLTPSSWLRGPGFSGLRDLLRTQDLAVVDLGGDLRAGEAGHALAVRSPACALVVARGGERGHRMARASFSESLNDFSSLSWGPVAASGPLEGAPRFPPLDRVFPWVRSGVKVGRTWPVAAAPAALEVRWQALLAATPEGRRALFKDSPTGRSVDPLLDLPADTPCPPIRALGWRTFDRRWVLFDSRLMDRSAGPLWAAHSPLQRYLTTGGGVVPRTGPAASLSFEVPDLHHFSGRGARDVIPLWQDADGHQANVSAEVVDALKVRPEAVFWYAAAVLCQPAFGARLGGTTQVQVPLTADPGLFAEGVALGRRLADGPMGRSQCTQPIRIAAPPRRVGDTLHIGDGVVAGLTEAVWAFEVAGLPVARHFITSRLGGGRTSSALDGVVPWDEGMTADLLENLWKIEHLLSLAPDMADWLDRVLGGSFVAV